MCSQPLDWWGLEINVLCMYASHIRNVTQGYIIYRLSHSQVKYLGTFYSFIHFLVSINYGILRKNQFRVEIQNVAFFSVERCRI